VFVSSLSCGAPTVDRRKSNTRYDLAVDFLRNGDLNGAEAEARKAIEYFPKHAEAYNVLGLVHLLRAVQNLHLVEVGDCLTGVDAEGLRAEMVQELGHADKSFAKASEIDGKYGEALANRGVVAMNLDDFKGAISHFEGGLEHPTRLRSASLTRANLGWAYFNARNYVRAAKELRQASQFQPGMCLASYRLGRVYFERKEWDKALEKFREVAAQAAECPIQEAHLYLAKTYLEAGMTSEISQATDSCVRLFPKSCLAAKCRALAADVPSPIADATP